LGIKQCWNREATSFEVAQTEKARKAIFRSIRRERGKCWQEKVREVIFMEPIESEASADKGHPQRAAMVPSPI